VVLACACNFLLLASYYILRPVRDTVATIYGVDQLQQLFTATFVGTILASAAYSALASRVRLLRLLPGVFWFWLISILLFAVLMHRAPGRPGTRRCILCLVQRRQPVHDLGVLEPDGRRVRARPGYA